MRATVKMEQWERKRRRREKSQEMKTEDGGSLSPFLSFLRLLLISRLHYILLSLSLPFCFLLPSLPLPPASPCLMGHKFFVESVLKTNRYHGNTLRKLMKCESAP